MGGFKRKIAGITAITLFAGALLAGCDSTTDYVPETANIYRIERTCDFTKTTKTGSARTSVESVTDDCDLTETYRELRDQGKERTKTLVGRGKLLVTYKSPADQSQLTGSIPMTGRDDIFYSAKAHDDIAIRVSKSDPSNIRLQ